MKRRISATSARVRSHWGEDILGSEVAGPPPLKATAPDEHGLEFLTGRLHSANLMALGHAALFELGDDLVDDFLIQAFASAATVHLRPLA